MTRKNNLHIVNIHSDFSKKKKRAILCSYVKGEISFSPTKHGFTLRATATSERPCAGEKKVCTMQSEQLPDF